MVKKFVLMVLVLCVLGMFPNAFGDDVYYYVSLNKLKIDKGELPASTSVDESLKNIDRSMRSNIEKYVQLDDSVHAKGRVDVGGWTSAMSGVAGLIHPELLELHSEKLKSLRLMRSNLGYPFHPGNDNAMTKLGLSLCEFITKYD